jgi:hypothetical protein
VIAALECFGGSLPFYEQSQELEFLVSSKYVQIFRSWFWENPPPVGTFAVSEWSIRGTAATTLMRVCRSRLAEEQGVAAMLDTRTFCC